MSNPQPFEFKGDYITLGQFLKATDQVQSGGEVKNILSAGAVLVNGTTETRRGRKLRQGDIVLYGRLCYRLESTANRL